MSDINKGYTFTDKSTDWVSNKETAIRLNKMLDDAKLNLVAGTNISITPTANGPSISASGGGTGSVTSVDLTAGTGISVSGGPITTSGSITVNNTAPDQVVSLTGAGTTTVTGTYPSFTVTSNDAFTGTVTAVTGTLPIVSTGGTTPAISINAATTSAPGSMSAADKTKLDGIAANANNYSLPKATSTVLGGVELFSDTVQTVAANAVTTTSARTYGVQLNATDQMVVNVPWIDGTFANQTEKTFFAGPTSGSAAAPTFRVIASTDLPAFGSGDVSFAVAGGAGTIAANAVTNAKAAQMATQTIKGRTTASTGNAEDLTATQATAILNAAVGATGSVAGTKGLVPAPAIGDQVKFLRGDMTYQTAGVPISVANRAALRAYTGAVDKQFIVEQGYYSEGDGGGGLWHFMAGDDNSVDNDGTLVVPGGVRGTVAGLNGCWHRDGPGTARSSVVKATKLDVRWFGAIPNKSQDCGVPFTNAFDALKIGSSKLDGTIYAPAGPYAFTTPVTIDVTGLDIKTSLIGDGPGGTVFVNSMTASQTHLFKFIGFDSLTLEGFVIQRISIAETTFDPTRVIHIQGGQAIRIINVNGRDNGINTPSTFIEYSGIGGGSWIEVANCKTYGTGNIGTQLLINSGGGIISNCHFKTSLSTPCLWIKASNSLTISDCFFEGGGPTRSFSGASIASNSSAFTVTASAHGFSIGDYVLLRGATIGGYNGVWKVATASAGQFTVTSTANLGSASATLSTLWSCAAFGGRLDDLVTESSIDNCLFNTSGGPAEGSVGIWLNGRDGKVVGLKISQCTMDYGYTALLAHGITTAAPTALGPIVYESNVSSITITACSPNGGPRDTFGGFRLEGVTGITLANCFCSPGNDLFTSTAGAGKTYNSVVISDGGQTYFTQDINITGGQFTDPTRSTFFNLAAMRAFVFDGPNVRRVSITGVGVDTLSANAVVSSLINGASISNGISVVYSNNSGFLNIGNANILGGTGVFSITQTDQAKLVPELGYGTSGTVDVRLDLKTSNYIGLVGNTTFTFSGIASGSYIFLALKNTTGGSITLNWPAINWASVSTPTSLAAGDSLLLRIFAFGTTYSDTFASY
jgi:hypothetical protein